VRKDNRIKSLKCDDVTVSPVRRAKNDTDPRRRDSEQLVLGSTCTIAAGRRLAAGPSSRHS